MLVLQNRYLHYSFITMTLLVCLIYSIPNFYPDQPCITIAAKNEDGLAKLTTQLSQLKLGDKFTIVDQSIDDTNLILRFNDISSQMQAHDLLQNTLDENYETSLNLLPSTPNWLKYLGAQPMKLGLDLRGGVHLLLQVDTEHANNHQSNVDLKDILLRLRQTNVDYDKAEINSDKIIIHCSEDNLSAAKSFFKNYYPKHKLEIHGKELHLQKTSSSEKAKQHYLMQKTLESVEKRVNELGLSEAIVQRQGQNQISVDIPGIQDINKAKAIIGNTATLSFHLVDYDNNENSLQVDDRQGNTLSINPKPILTGDAITYASTTTDNGQPLVQVRLGGGNEQSFYQATRENIGKQIAIVISEKKANKQTHVRNTSRSIISAPVVQQALNNQFVINGMRSAQEAETLSLLLRSGSLAAPIDIVEEMTVGPSLGSDNIHKGVLSIAAGFAGIVVFMLVYYRTFGIIANIGLMFNLVMILTLLSWLDATMTLPSMAAVVLSVGMAVDANVLINERIREELRLGKNDIEALHLGYERAFATILDANVTTLIVSIVLYGLGSGVIKGFAVTLIIGLGAAMFTSVYVTRIITWSLFNRLGNIATAVGI